MREREIKATCTLYAWLSFYLHTHINIISILDQVMQEAYFSVNQKKKISDKSMICNKCVSLGVSEKYKKRNLVCIRSFRGCPEWLATV